MNESIDIIDNSHLHKGHKSFNKNTYHLKLNIKSNQLNSIKNKCPEMIMKLLEDDLKTKIHAIEINIENSFTHFFKL